jgi:LacI family transcriptional regulator
MHGQDKVRASTRQRVLAVIEALGYVPDSAAQSMARQRKEVVGLLAPAKRGPDTDVEQEGLLFIDEVMRGAESSLFEADWSLLISLLRHDDPAAIYQRVQKLSGKVDGLLMIEGLCGADQLRQLTARMPVVVVAGSPEQTHVDVVGADNTTGIKALVSHLVEQHGRTRLFFVAGPAEAPDARERQSAFEDAVAAHPGVIVTGFFQGLFATTSGQLAAQEILCGPRGELPDAILCANDQMAIGAIRELNAAGLRVPQDIAVTGFDDMHTAALVTPALTTVHQPMQLLGERACSRLLQRIAQPDLPCRVERLPAEMVIRQSCGCNSAGSAR